MRIVLTSDTHKPFDEDMIPDGDVFIHCGDLMYSGLPDEWPGVLASLAALPHKVKLLVPGNHDFHIQNYQGVATAELRRAGVGLLGLNNPIINVNDINILGIPFVTGLPGWAFNREEDWLFEYLTQFNDKDIDIVISHAPVYNILDAVNPEALRWRDQAHVGGWATNRWYNQKTRKPKVWACGHIHESYGRHLTDETAFYNVAMCDRSYEQVNKPFVVDLGE